MFQKARETTFLESTSLLMTVLRWRKPLLAVTFISALAAGIFSGPSFITPKYKSTVIFFPPATNSISKALLDEHSSDKQDILAFGEEEQAEQMLQILNSDEIREAIIRKYKLMKHYGICPDEAYRLTRLSEEFHDNISFSRTEFMSVRIDVLDKDPAMAASIANDIAALLDSMKSKIQRSRASEALLIVEQTYQEKLQASAVKEDSLTRLREMGVMDYRNQSVIWNEEYAKSYASLSNDKAALGVLLKYKPDNDTSVINTRARIRGAESRLKDLQGKLDLLARYGGASVSLTEQLTLDREELAKMKEQVDKLRLDANQQLSHKFLVNKAVQAEKKSYPVRWMIVLMAGLGGFLIALLVLLGTERYREIRYRI